MMSSGAGADFVMMGGMLAGHDQSGELYRECMLYSIVSRNRTVATVLLRLLVRRIQILT